MTNYIDPTLSLKDLISLQRKRYKQFVPVNCHMLNETVFFTFAGFEHLHMDGRKKRRGEKSARSRLMLMEHAPAVITQSRFMKKDLKEANETYSGKNEEFYELFSRVGIKQVAVIVTLRRVGQGDLHFYGIRYKWKKTA